METGKRLEYSKRLIRQYQITLILSTILIAVFLILPYDTGVYMGFGC